MEKEQRDTIGKLMILFGISIFLLLGLSLFAHAAPPTINTCSIPNTNMYVGGVLDINYSVSGSVDLNRFIFVNDDTDQNISLVTEYFEYTDFAGDDANGWSLGAGTTISSEHAEAGSGTTVSISKDVNNITGMYFVYNISLGPNHTDNTATVSILDDSTLNGYIYQASNNNPYAYNIYRRTAGVNTVIKSGDLGGGNPVNNLTAITRDDSGLITLVGNGITVTDTTHQAFGFLSATISGTNTKTLDNPKLQGKIDQRTKSYTTTSDEFLDYIQYWCYAKNGDGETFNGPHTYNATIDLNIAINVWDSNTGNIASDYTLTLVDGSLQSFENQRYFNLSQFLTRTNTDPDQRQLTHTVTAFDNNTLSIFPPVTEQFLLSEDTNSYDMNLTTASWSFSIHNQTTSGGCTLGNNHCWRLWYAEDEEDLFQSILIGQWLDGSGNIPTQVQANIPTGLTTIDFGGPINLLTIEHSQSLQWFNNAEDANNLDFNVMIITPTTLAQVQVRDKQGKLMPEVLIEVYQDLTTAGELYLYDREYTGYRDGDGIVLFPIDANQMIKIVASREGYETVTRIVEAGLFNDTGNIIEITLLTEEEFDTAYRIVATPINPYVLSAGTEARVFTEIGSPMKVCYQTFHNTDTNEVENANNPAASSILQTSYVTVIDNPDINYMIRVMVDRDGDQNCFNSVVNTFQWKLVEGIGQDSFEDIETLDPVEQEIFEWYGTLAIIVIGIIGGAIIGRGTPIFFVSIILFAIWQIVTFQMTSLVMPMFLGLVWIMRDNLHNAMGGNR